MNDDQKEILKSLLPYLIVTALVSATLVLGVLKLSGFGGHGSAGLMGARVVTFDIVKYTNAQRAVAAQFIGRDDSDSANLLLDVSKRTRQEIEKVAGKGAIVLVKQAIVQGDTDDITDVVLKDLGLPTDVPSQDPSKFAFDVAPTMLFANTGKKRDSAADAQAPAGSAANKVLP